MMAPATSAYAEVAHVPTTEATVEPRTVERGVVVFDLDGTLLDDIGLISLVAGEVLAAAFGTPAEEARIHYLATTGMPFEAQLAQLYPDAPPEERHATARKFHEKKVKEAYSHAAPFAEIPKLLKQLDRDRWTLVVSTGAERETADLLLEREGLRYWFEGVLGSGQGTKREHLAEYRRRYPGVPFFLVGDSRFDMEAALSVPGVVPVGRASMLPGWSLTPDDLMRWGAAWAEYSLSSLPTVLPELPRSKARARKPTSSRPSRRK
jgi:phosphoglycolate phosphatase-like HAD superfamily hydrolase